MSLLEKSGMAPRRLRGSHLLIILFATVVTVLAAIGAVGLRPDAYASQASVVVKPEVVNGVPMEPQMGTEAATAASGNVLRRAAQLLGATEADIRDGLSVSVPVDTTVVEIEFEASTPTAAFQGADAVTRAYVDYRNSGSEARVAEVITRPGVPRGPSAVNYALVVALALLGGLILGGFAAVLWERAVNPGARAGLVRPALPGSMWRPGTSWDSAGLSVNARSRRDAPSSGPAGDR
jgi:capsular polysaccharide biosynthesis protein